MVSVEVDQGRARQRGGLHGDPQESERLARGHQRHRGQEQQQAGGERGLRRIVEEEALLEVLAPSGHLAAQVRGGVDGSCEEEHARDAQEQSPESVEPEPAAPPRGWLGDPGRPGEGCVGDTGQDQKHPARGIRPHEIRDEARQRRDQQQGGDHRSQSLRTVS